MLASKQQVPHFYLTIDLDADRLADTRAQLNAAQPDDAKLSVNDFVVKAAALALRDVPGLNASLRGESIQRHAQVNVGVAVAIEDGLLTIVVRDADTKPLRQIADEIRAMVGRARQGRVRPDDVDGSTFTVSNLGMFDIDHFVAIINPPEAAILAVGSVRETPVVRDGQLAPGLRLKVTLSADHRVTDGAEAARWLQALRARLEHPLGMLL
jgi:pyruvate dehydrogenase E2 component (dihydrolipoamide acetyltransferase)